MTTQQADRAEKPDLCDAGDTDEIYGLAYDLAAWGLRNGECDELDAVEWVLGHAHDEKLPRGSSGRLNPTKHHIRSGAQNAAKTFIPGVQAFRFDPEPLHELAGRIDGSGVTHERYLVGAVALCHKFSTFSPVITGPLLAQVVGVNESNAGAVLSKWSKTLAYGMFTKVTYDGEIGHGRVWHVDVGWQPTSKPKHLPGCNRSRDRCVCPGLSQNGVPIFTAAKIDTPKCDSDRFSEWVSGLKSGSPVTVTSASQGTGLTRYAATKQLKAAEGTLLKSGTYSGGRVRRRSTDGTFRWMQQGETWFVA
jgi:hypothetical protein